MENQTMIIGSGINGYIYAVATQGVSILATSEAVYSQLPGREDGPADAYRHILLAAELTRQFGETYANTLLNGHEFTGNHSFFDPQTAEANVMDLYNNQLGIEIGKRLAEDPNASWKDVVNEARELFDPNDNNGDGARWLDTWNPDSNPKDDVTKLPIPNGDPRLNWPAQWGDKPFYDYPESLLGKWFDGMLKDAQGLLAGAAWGMADAINGLFNAAIQARYGSPLTLDLDGDGVETVGIDINHLVLFDNNNDGIKTATGWVKSDDGLLVLDRNANGTIDNGSELFGDNTWIYDNNDQPIEKASNGFDALAQYDTNQNGKIDEADSIYTNLKIWQDYNQNGISESNELKTLTQANIVSISLSSTQTNITVISMLVSFIKPISNNSLYKANLQRMA